MELDISNAIANDKNVKNNNDNFTKDLLESLEKALDEKNYVINTNTGTFHLENSGCNNLVNVKEEILATKVGLEKEGLTACKKCVGDLAYDVRVPLSKREELDKEYENVIDKTNYNFIDLSEKYKDYWESRVHNIEDDVASTIGLSKSKLDELTVYKNDLLGDAIDKSIFEIANREKITICRKQFGTHNSNDEMCYSISKYERNRVKPKYENIKANDTLNEYEDDDILFQYNKDGSITVREDLRKEALYLACEKCMKYKEEQDKEIKENKIEGHIYQTESGNENVFLEDIETGEVFEDIDFVNDIYDYTTAVYQVQDGEYVKIQQGYYEE